VSCHRGYPVCPEGARFNIIGITLALAGLAACATQYRSTYPVLERIAESDSDLGCAGFDDELLKANAIRDAIFDERGDVISDAYIASAVDVVSVAVDPVGGMLGAAINGLSTSKASKTYIEAAAAAGLRMEQLLVYKQEHGCPSTSTGDPQLTEARVLTKLQQLEVQLCHEEITQAQHFSERRKLLDGLR